MNEQREKDGFPKKIKIKKLIKDQNKTVVIPLAQEEKLVHDTFKPDSQDETGGQGEGEEGEKTGEKPIDEGDEGGEGEEEGDAGQGSGGDHGISKESYELGKQLSEKLNLPNLQDKGKKVPIPEWTYDLTDKTRKTGQFLDKKETIKNIIRTNLLLGRIDPYNIDPTKLIIDPSDKVFNTLSRERQYQSQAMVFFVRDYSGSMYGKPTQIVCDLHVMLYTWLIYQYNERVTSRFIVHDTEAKEVKDFNEYYRLNVGGGTYISSAYKLVNNIIENENLERDYNLYLFQGSDGDDWTEDNTVLPGELEKIVNYCNRVGISVIKTRNKNMNTELEQILNNSLLLTEYKDKLKMTTVDSDEEEKLENALIEMLSEG